MINSKYVIVARSAFALMFGGAVFLLFLGIVNGDNAVVYIALALLAGAIPLLAEIGRESRFDPFSPMVIAAAAFVFGTSARSFYFAFENSDKVEFLKFGATFDEVVAEMPVMLLGVVAMTVAYRLTTYRLPLEKVYFFRTGAFRRNGVIGVIGLTAVLGLVGTAMFISAHGIDFSKGLLALSSKKALAFVGDDGEVVYGAGYQQFLAKFSQYGLLILFGLMVAGHVRRSLGLYVILAGLFFLSSVTPFLASSRSSILVLVLCLMIIGSYYVRVKPLLMLGLFVLAIAFITVMGNLRSINQTGEAREGGALEAVVGSGNGIDLYRSVAIMKRVPQYHDFLRGSSYLSLVTGFIPRAIWAEKPNPSLGPWVKSELFGEDVRNNGWPPGMVAEAYINFGGVGIVLCMAAWGAILKVFYASFRPLLGVSAVATIVYGASVWRLAFGTLGLNFAQGVLQTLQFLIPVVLFLLLVVAWPSRRRVGRRLVAAE